MLNKIIIDNFKSLKHLEYDCAGLNLMTGLNGAGKSSFIQMLRMMQKASDRIGDPSLTISAKELGDFSSGDFWCCYAHDSEIRVSADYSLQSEPHKKFSMNRVMCDGGVTNVRDGIVIRHPDWEKNHRGCYGEYDRLSWKKIDGGCVADEEVSVAYSNGMEKFAVAEKGMRDADAESSDAFEKLWKGSRFIDAFRLKPVEVHSGGQYSFLVELTGDLSIEGFDPEGQDVAEYIYKSKGLVHDSNELLDRINSCLDWVSPGARLFVRKQDVGGQEYFIESVGFGHSNAERLYKPQNVGFGISYILPVLVTLLTARPGSILIIENPEAHLHPRGQAEIGKLIAETVARGVQAFVETHSDHVINGIRVAVKKGIVKPEDVNIAFFERGPHDVSQKDGTTRREIYSEVTNIKVDANGSLSEWPKDFMDEWGIQQMKLLRP